MSLPGILCLQDLTHCLQYYRYINGFLIDFPNKLIENPDILDFLPVDGLRLRNLNLFDQTVDDFCGQLLNLGTFRHFIGKTFRFICTVLQIFSRRS